MGNTADSSGNKYETNTCCGQCSLEKISVKYIDLSLSHHSENSEEGKPSVFIASQELKQEKKDLSSGSELCEGKNYQFLVSGCHRANAKVLNVSLVNKNGLTEANGQINLISADIQLKNSDHQCELKNDQTGEVAGKLLFTIGKQKIQFNQYLFRIQEAFLRLPKYSAYQHIIEINTGLDVIVFDPKKENIEDKKQMLLNPWRKTYCGRVQTEEKKSPRFVVKILKRKGGEGYEIVGYTQFSFSHVQEKVSLDLDVFSYNSGENKKEETVIGMINLGIMPGNIPEAMLPPESALKNPYRKYSSPVKLKSTGHELYPIGKGIYSLQQKLKY